MTIKMEPGLVIRNNSDNLFVCVLDSSDSDTSANKYKLRFICLNDSLGKYKNQPTIWRSKYSIGEPVPISNAESLGILNWENIVLRVTK